MMVLLAEASFIHREALLVWIQTRSPHTSGIQAQQTFCPITSSGGSSKLFRGSQSLICQFAFADGSSHCDTVRITVSPIPPPGRVDWMQSQETSHPTPGPCPPEAGPGLPPKRCRLSETRRMPSETLITARRCRDKYGLSQQARCKSRSFLSVCANPLNITFPRCH